MNEWTLAHLAEDEQRRADLEANVETFSDCRHGELERMCLACAACEACDGSCGVCPYVSGNPS